MSAILAYQTSREKRKVVIFDCRALTDVEKRYNQLYKETFAVVFDFERLNVFIYDSDFDIVIDNKPPAALLRNSLVKMPVYVLKDGTFANNNISSTSDWNPEPVLSSHYYIILSSIRIIYLVLDTYIKDVTNKYLFV